MGGNNLTWKWYQWPSIDEYETWHSNLLSTITLGEGSTRYNDPALEIDNTVKSMVEDDYAEGLQPSNEPSWLRQRPN